MKPTNEEIKTRAYFLWLGEGRPIARALDNWLEAEALANYDWHKSGKTKIQFPHGNLTVPFN